MGGYSIGSSISSTTAGLALNVNGNAITGSGVNSSMASPNNRPAGNLSISNGITGNIVIGGTINLDNPLADTYERDLTLTTSGGIIDLAGLDMATVRYANGWWWTTADRSRSPSAHSSQPPRCFGSGESAEYLRQAQGRWARWRGIWGGRAGRARAGALPKELTEADDLLERQGRPGRVRQGARQDAREGVAGVEADVRQETRRHQSQEPARFRGRDRHQRRRGIIVPQGTRIARRGDRAQIRPRREVCGGGFSAAWRPPCSPR